MSETQTKENQNGVPQEQTALDLGHPDHYINRELSVLEFQRRVLEEAYDKNNPLLERIRFLAIVGSNLDEFFMVRLGGLKLQIEAGVVDLPPDGLTPAEQLAQSRRVAYKLMVESQKLFETSLLPELNENGIQILHYDELNEKQLEKVEQYFEQVVFPVLTPLAFDPGHPFPHISNLSLNLAIVIEDDKGIRHFARMKVPSTLPRFIPIKRSSGSFRRDGTVPHEHYFVWIEEVISANIEKLFPGMKVIASYPFHITRNADMIIQELEADDLLEMMENSVRQRRFGSVVRLAINPTMPKLVLSILKENLGVDPNDIFEIDGPLSYSDMMFLPNAIDRYELKFAPFQPAIPSNIELNAHDGDFFSMIRQGDILLHHPYNSFDPVITFLAQAARDPDVLAIKSTLYRVGSNAPVVNALLEARENGKQVAVLVELKARFDEESNIVWAKVLEREGVHVTYGLLGLKTHSKIALVVRREGESMHRYIHLSTGNYNSSTARIYEDIGLFTDDEQIGEDASHLFNALTGYSNKKDYGKLLVAPHNLRIKVEEYIIREIENQKKSGNGKMILKTNALVDKNIISLLYEASRAGVQVDLLVRGICCLRPGVPGMSENIRVRSVVGRFLEHSRIYYFHNGGQEEIYLGSADLMPRNLNRRVEVLFPVEDPKYIHHIRDYVLETYLTDNVRTRIMQSDGTYERLQPGKKAPIDVQAKFLEDYQKVIPL